MPTAHKLKTVILEAFEDESVGTLGLGLEGMPCDDITNASGTGALIAHDLLEHVNGPQHIGGIPDELEALGALWFTRGQHGELNRDGSGSHYSVGENIAHDLTRMFRDHFYGAGMPTTKRVRPVGDQDESLKEIVAVCMRDAPREVDTGDTCGPELRAYCRAALYRMRMGYRKAYRMHRGDAHAANRLFWAVAAAVHPHASRVDYEGQRFELTYGTDKHGDAVARCEELFWGSDE